MEHAVWSILNKDIYTEDGIKKEEEIYDFLKVMVDTVGILPMRTLFDMWNDYSSETFRILSELVHTEDEKK